MPRSDIRGSVAIRQHWGRWLITFPAIYPIIGGYGWHARGELRLLVAQSNIEQPDYVEWPWNQAVRPYVQIGNRDSNGHNVVEDDLGRPYARECFTGAVPRDTMHGSAISVPGLLSEIVRKRF